MHADPNNQKSLGIKMIEIPGGEIRLRDDRIKREWIVEIEAFLISGNLVTQKLYFDITGETPSSFLGENNPVENVSWLDAVNFCNLLSGREGLEPFYTAISDNISINPSSNGYHLPSEAEWEYACKAGSPGVRYGEIDQIAWYSENSDGRTHEVGTKEPNQWGLYDMLGNVWEWCADVYDESLYGSYRIFRGGGWNDEARGCMATNRRRSHPSAFRIDDLGFRIARNLSLQ